MDPDTSKPFAVDSLTISSAGRTGLFGVISGGKVTSLNLTNVVVDGSSTNREDRTGAIAGYILNTVLENCLVSGSVKGFCYVGGLVGQCSNSSIKNCSSSADVTGEGLGVVWNTGAVYYVGGLIGKAENNSSIVSSSNSGKVFSNSTNDSKYIGGLVGHLTSSELKDSFYKGELEVKSSAGLTDCSGGLIGELAAPSGPLLISGCFNEGSISVSSNYETKFNGGLIGNVDGTFATSINIIACHNKGIINATSNNKVNCNGGLFGQISNRSSCIISDCFNNSEVSSVSTNNNVIYTGGLIGRSQYVNLSLSNCSNAGKISAKAKQSVQYTGGLVGYSTDFPSSVSLVVDGCFNSGVIDVNSEQYYIELSGGLFGYVFSKSPVYFSGNYNSGPIFVESNSFSRYSGGLAGRIYNQSSITNLTFCSNSGSVNVKSSGGYVYYTGGLAGEVRSSNSASRSTGNKNSGNITAIVNPPKGNYYTGGLFGVSRIQIEMCQSKGIVYGKNSVGGLAGDHYSSTIVDSFCTGDVLGGAYVGGLIGRAYYGKIYRCYSTGKVRGSSSLGGLIGYNYAGSATNCYWDIETSKVSNSQGEQADLPKICSNPTSLSPGILLTPGKLPTITGLKSTRICQVLPIQWILPHPTLVH